MGRIELVALLSMCSWCLVNVVWLFLAVPWVCLQFVIVVHVFPDHTHLLFLIRGLVPDACLWLAPLWFNLGNPFALTFCELRALVFV